jgi:hemolysin III
VSHDDSARDDRADGKLGDGSPLNTPKTPRRFSILWFSIQMLGQYALLLAAIRFLLPSVWTRQIDAGWLAFALVFLVAHLGLCFFEWGFHRYVLHSVTTSWLVWFARGHRHHHSLTPIRLQPVTEGSDRYVLNRYPITEEAQYPDSAFPVYANAAFWLVFSPLLIGLQLLLPRLPILLGGFTAITWSMCLYEILHAIEHQPYEWWKGATEHPRLGFMWRQLYGFHHMHHANVSCNEAISGFFGLPVADWALGTYHQPRELLLEGRMATAKDFAIPAPPRLVRWLDSWAKKRESRMHRAK